MWAQIHISPDVGLITLDKLHLEIYIFIIS